MFSQACVKNSVKEGGVCVFQHALVKWVYPSQHALQRTVSILLECILVALIFYQIKISISTANGSRVQEKIYSV